MRLYTKNSKNSDRLKKLVESVGGNPNEPFFFCWETDLFDYSNAVGDMSQALLCLTANNNDEVDFANVPAKQLHNLGWDIQGVMWKNSAVVVFVRR
jgi:hypothetical protein